MVARAPRRHEFETRTDDRDLAKDDRRHLPASLRSPDIVLGVGLGGFVDGILKFYSPHTVSGLEMNTVWDGIFHVVCWLSVLTGLAVLYSRVTHQRSTTRSWESTTSARALTGSGGT
ncbi:Predicted membrane protein [Actinomadura madurae]|nr:Predicted membrane protein [Actinomadura madurae]